MKEYITQTLNELLKTLPEYKRPSCINCDYKIFCVGECEQTLK